MGWCSATEIMDTALSAAEAAVKEAIGGYAQGNADTQAIQLRVDEVLRPFVEKLASMLRDADWDCIEESDYYDRFAQEMHGDDDREYETRLIEGLHEAHETDRPHWLERLNRHRVKMEESNNGTG